MKRYILTVFLCVYGWTLTTIDAQNTNKYGIVGQAYYNYILTELDESKEGCDLRPVLSKYLDKLEFQTEVPILYSERVSEYGILTAGFYHLPDCYVSHREEYLDSIHNKWPWWDWSPSTTKIYEEEYKSQGHWEMSRACLNKRIILNNDLESIWQYFLFDNLSWDTYKWIWHGKNYQEVPFLYKYIFSVQDIYEIEELTEFDRARLVKLDLLPHVQRLDKHEDVYNVSCCVWNGNELIRLLAKYQYKDGTIGLLEIDKGEILRNRDRPSDKVPSQQYSNEYCRVGHEFYSFLKNDINGPCKNFDLRPYLAMYLDKLTFPEEVSLHYAEFRGSGSHSWFYFESDLSKKFLSEFYKEYNIKNPLTDGRNYEYFHEEFVAKNFYKRIMLSCDEQAAWQYYLIRNSSHVMQTYWHGGYLMNNYILSEQSLNEELKYAKKRYKSVKRRYRELLGGPIDVEKILGRDDLFPDVTIDGDTAIVRCCYWNDWEGLIKETVTIKIVNQEVESYTIKKETILEYNCWIMF